LCEGIKGGSKLAKFVAEFGPISLLAIGFPEIKNLDGALIKELLKLSDAYIIKIIGLMAISKDGKGKVKSVQLTEFSDEERVRLGAAIGALIGFGAAGKEGADAGANAGAEAAYYKEFGLNKEQIKNIAKDMPNGTAAGFLLIEHLWAKTFKELAMEKHGVVLANGFISPASLVALGAELAEGAKAAEKVKLK
jgi:uncharacterized membrane protein